MIFAFHCMEKCFELWIIELYLGKVDIPTCDFLELENYVGKIDGTRQYALL